MFLNYCDSCYVYCSRFLFVKIKVSLRWITLSSMGWFWLLIGGVEIRFKLTKGSLHDNFSGIWQNEWKFSGGAGPQSPYLSNAKRVLCHMRYTQIWYLSVLLLIYTVTWETPGKLGTAGGGGVNPGLWTCFRTIVNIVKHNLQDFYLWRLK